MCKKNTIYIGIFVAIIIIAGSTLTAFAADLNDAFKNPDYLDKVAGPDGAGYRSDTDAPALIGKVIQAILSFVGVIFLVLMIYGGYVWMLARGNEQEVERAKKLITAAIIGVIVIMSAYAISYLIFDKVGNTTMQL